MIPVDPSAHDASDSVSLLVIAIIPVNTLGEEYCMFNQIS